MQLLTYTRSPLEDLIYNSHMAYSMHLAYRGEDGLFHPFRHNEGVLFAKAIHHPDGTMTAKCLQSPRLFRRAEGDFGAVAVRVETDGSPDSSCAGQVLTFVSRDLVHYEEAGLYQVADEALRAVSCVWEEAAQAYRLVWQTVSGEWRQGLGNPYTGERVHAVTAADPLPCPVTAEEISALTGAQPCGTMEVTAEEADYLQKKLLTPTCVSVTVEGEGEAARAKALYSDGTVVTRKIDWTNLSPEAHMGLQHQEHFPAPFASNRADPCLMYWHNAYYFIATNDLDGNHSLYIRKSATLQGIETAMEAPLLDSKTYPDIGGLLWAPEFHEINGHMYIFHAATRGPFFEEESRVMALRDGGDPMNRADWSRPHLVVCRDGAPLCEAGKVISLDMTPFEVAGRYYVMWSQRQFLPVDQGAWLMCAEIDPDTPWQLLTDPVCIAKPEYSWENNHTFVVEGPYALRRNGHLMITYSGAAVDATYCVGLLRLKDGCDPLAPASWVKGNYPLLSSSCVPGEYGPGHNAYVEDENGLVWNSYHAHVGVKSPRSSCMRRVHFDVDGEPMLDVTEKEDFPKMMRHVDIRLDTKAE